jgi:hypothetical protein
VGVLWFCLPIRAISREFISKKSILILLGVQASKRKGDVKESELQKQKGDVKNDTKKE